MATFDVSHGDVATSKPNCGDIFMTNLLQIHYESVGKRIMKIGQYLSKLRPEDSGIFSDTLCICTL